MEESARAEQQAEQQQRQVNRWNLGRMVMDGVLTLVVSVVGYTVVAIHNDLRALKDEDVKIRAEFNEQRVRTAIEFVRKEDLGPQLNQILRILERLESRLDTKQDKAR